MDGPRLHVRGPKRLCGRGAGHRRSPPRRPQCRAGRRTGGWMELVGRGAAEQEGRGGQRRRAGSRPFRRLAAILCFGVNYVEHALEGGRPPTKWPEVFVRGAESVRRPLRRPGQAPPHLDGLTLRASWAWSSAGVDGTSGAEGRPGGDHRLHDRHGRHRPGNGSGASTQWTPGKNFDGTMPVGPEIVTTDELDASDVASHNHAQRRGHAVGEHGADDLRHPALRLSTCRRSPPCDPATSSPPAPPAAWASPARRRCG